MTVELLTASGEFDRKPEQDRWETTMKFAVSQPNFFDFMKIKYGTQFVERIYLSELAEPYTMTAEKVVTADGREHFTAWLANQAREVPNGTLHRISPEVIDQDMFETFATMGAPRLYAERVEPVQGVSIEWIEGYYTIVDITDIGINPQAQAFYQEYRSVLDGVVETPQALDGEWIAHHLVAA